MGVASDAWYWLYKALEVVSNAAGEASDVAWRLHLAARRRERLRGEPISEGWPTKISVTPW